jgi:hypothetical protein
MEELKSIASSRAVKNPRPFSIANASEEEKYASSPSSVSDISKG